MEPTVNCCTSHSQNSDSRGFRWGLCLILIIGLSSLLFGHTAHGASTTAKFCVNKSQMVLATTKTGGCGKGETKITWSSKSKARVCITRNKTLKYAKTGTCPKGSTRASLRNINGSLVTCVKPSTRQLVWKSTVTCPKSYVASPLDLQVAETTTTTSQVPTTIVTSGNSETTTTLPSFPTTTTPATSSTTTVPSGTSSTSSSSTTTSPSTTTTSPPLTTTSSTTIPVTTTTIAVTTSTSTSTTTTTTTTTTVPATTTTTAAPEPSSITYFFTGNPTINEGSTTYLWAYYSGVTATVDNGIGAMPNALAIDVTPNVTTTYTLTVSNGAGHTSTATVTITVIPSAPSTTTTTVPSGTTTSTTTTTTSSTTTTTTTTTVPPSPSSITYFIVGATPINEGDSTYLWAYYSGATASVDNGIGSMPNGLSVSITPTATTTYTLTVTNGAGHTSTATVTVTVIPSGGTTTTTTPPTTTTSPPTTTTVPTGTTTTTTTTVPGDGNSLSISLQPTDATVVLGNSHTFSVTATASGTLSYQWYYNDSAIAGATTNQYIANTAGSYKVDVQSTLNGSTRTITSNSASLTLRGAAITSVSSDSYLTQGLSIPLAASISTVSGVTVTYQWTLDGVDIPNANSIGIVATQGGDYALRVTSSRNNMTMTQTSSTIHVTVVPVPTITSFDSLAQTISYGGSTDLVPVFSHGSAVINPGNIPVNSGDQIRVSPQTTTNYVLVVTNAAGTQNARSYTVTVTTGVFIDISNAMSANRWFGSQAIALNDGRILIYGNHDAYGTKAVDIFNPISNTFSPAADLGLKRRDAPGVLLSNGKVLIAGGATYQTRYEAVNAPELYDPTSNTWSWTGSMSIARRNHFMIRMTNGNVLVGGGTDTNGNLLQSVEIYNPTTGLFSAAPDMPQGRSNALVAVLPNGKVIVFGGYGGSSGTLSSAIVFDPTNNTWSSIASQMQIGHGQGATLVTLSDGRIMVAGGWSVSGGTQIGVSKTDIYDPATEQFVNGPSLTLQRAELTGHLLNDGKVVFIGGSSGTDVANSVDVYDPVTNNMIRQAKTMFHARYRHSSALLPDGRVLIIGGDYRAGNTGEIFVE